MNTLIENGSILEMACGSNFAYVLSDSGLFMPTEYKVLQSQANSIFVPCMKMLYNGNIQLYYRVKALKPFQSMIATLDTDSFLIIVANLFSDIIDVKHNGFLSCQNIDISFERIYIDPATYKVSLVYLPLSKRLFDDTAAFENEIRTALIRLISEKANLASPKTLQLSADLSNGTISIDDLFQRVKGGKQTTQIGKVTSPAQGRLRLVGMNTPTRVEITVTKDSFVIGKKQGAVDGVISFNDKISRLHCRIDCGDNQYTITDLKSANGTFVNGVRLQPNQPYPVNRGDVIRMANSDFQVNIG